MIIAVLMAGGKGKRMNSDVEKPLFEFNSKHLIDYVLSNLQNSQYIEKIVVATSPHTIETKTYIGSIKSTNQKIDCTTLETPGIGYLEDLSFLLSYFENISKNDVLVFISADLPFVSSNTIDYTIAKYLDSDKQGMSVLVPITIFNKYNIEPSHNFNDLVPSGLNILISQNIIQEEEKLVIPKLELALNINSIEDINIANDLINKKLIKNI